MANWIIPFINFDGESYEIRVHKPFAILIDSTLTGATRPIVIQEDNDEYMFTPVRQESGYIRIYDNGKDGEGENFYWNNMIPSSAVAIPVELWNVYDNDIEWVGFVQPTSFSGDFDAAPQEREYPVVGLLSILESYDFTLTETNPVSLATILYKVLTIPSVITNYIQFIFFQGVDAISNNQDLWLNYRVSPSLFMEIDEDGNPKAKYNCLEVLTQFCQYFGLTARMSGTSLYFASPASDIATMGFTRITMTDLANFISHSGSFSPVAQAFINDSLTEAMLVDTDNTETFVPGVGKVVVEEDVDKIDDTMSLPKEEFLKYGVKSENGDSPIYGTAIQKERYNGSSTTTGAGCLYYTYVNTALTNPSQGEYLYKYPFKDVDITIPLYGHGTQNDMQYSNIVISDWDDDAYEESGGTWSQVKHTYNWSSVLRLYKNSQWTNGPAVTLKSHIPIAIADGVLVLKMETRIDTIVSGSTRTHKIWPGCGTIKMSLQIGDYYWDPTNQDWTTTETIFDLVVGGEQSKWQSEYSNDGTGKLPNNRVLDGPYPPYNGYGIPVSSGMGGTITMVIYDIDVYNYMAIFGAIGERLDISDFSFEFLRGTNKNDWSNVEKNTWTEESGTKFRDEKTVSNIFTTDRNNAPGNGILFTPSAGYAEQLSFTASGGGSLGAPGEVLAQTIAGFYNKSRRMLQVNVRASAMTADAPRQKITFGSRTYYPIAISKDWWNDEKTIKMIEL